MQAQTNRIYEFGPFRLHEREGVLLRDDRPVPLTPKVFDTLLLLVENRGHLVLKEEIMSRLWPNSFVEDVNVNRNISTLRRALADSPNDPVYIETAPKRGYRFVASVVEVEMDNADLILERRTSAQIITEEEEEITDSPQSDHGGGLERVNINAHASSISRLRRHALGLSAVIILTLLSAVVCWWVVSQSGHAATTARVKSIAVLPFRDISATSDEHLGLNLADVLITRLSNFKDVNVRPTSAVMKFEGQEVESTAGGRLLGVDAVLEGSIYRSHEQIRVTARLVRVSDQSPIWSGQFDNQASDVLALQNAIAGQVADALSLNLSADEKASLTKRYSESADALQLYAKGRYYWNTRTWEGMDRAEYYFRRAIEKDPNFALAYVGLADRLFTNSEHPEAYVAVNKAIELDPTLGEAYATLGFANMFQEWNWQKAEENFKRAIELRPGYGTAHQWYATLLAITGRVDEAKRKMQRALEIDPTSANFLADAGQMHYFAHEYEEAEAYCRKALEVTPDFVFAHQYLFDIYLKTGRHTEASEELIKWTRSYKSANGRGPADNLRELYQQSGMNGLLRYRVNANLLNPLPGFCYEVAKSYARLGDKEQALGWLEKSCESKDFLLPFVNADPIFDELRSEARFQAVLHRMELARRNELAADRLP
ncbi:MAG TPA: tetratricopeptide repeat protein [Blastocatellia bacterium]|nr:tetratricopeptide repeat protein [Blastocatellia bacterium]